MNNEMNIDMQAAIRIAGENVVLTEQRDELAAALHNMLASAIPGMNWTDEIGQLILSNAKTALAKVQS